MSDQEPDSTNSDIENTAADTASSDEANAPDAATDQPSGAEELKQLKKDLESAQDQALRTQAELENFRRRTRNEQDEFRKYQALPVVRDLLPGNR